MSENNTPPKETKAPSEDKGPKKGLLPLKIAVMIVLLAAVVIGLVVKGGDEKRSLDSSEPMENASQGDGAASGAASPASGAGEAGDSGQFKIPPQDKGEDSVPFLIGLVTGAGSQGEDFFIGIQTVMERYGDADKGGLIRHRVYPDNFSIRLEEVIAIIEGLAEDPLIKVIVVVEAVPGTAEAFQKIKATRPDIVLLSAESHEDMRTTSATTDMYVGTDFISRGYLIPRTAKELGAKTLVHVSIPRHMLDESILRRRYIMEEACKDLGMNFVYQNAPDPTAETGTKFAQDFIAEHIPIWLNEHGKDTAFFATNNAHTEPMIAGIIEHGGYFVEADVPSPSMGYPAALNLDISDIENDYPQILNRIEKAIESKGASGRLGTWTASVPSSNIVGLVEFGKLVALGKIPIDDYETLLKCYEDAAQGVKWNGQVYVDANQETYPDIFLIYEDTYIFGRGFMGNTGVEIPFKYRTLVPFEASKS